MGRENNSWTLLKHSPDPSLRSYLVHRLGLLGVEPSLLISRLDEESDVSVRRALILSFGEYAEARLSTSEREALTKRLMEVYGNDPDAGIHSAADWLLRRWRNEDQLKVIDRRLAKLPLPTLRRQSGASLQENNREWYINCQGQTMVIVRGPVDFDMEDMFDLGRGMTQHRERIDHAFAIASKEVTVEQFQTYLKENSSIRYNNNEKYSPDKSCPMNSVNWYEAAAYCNWLSKKEGLGEDQWCYAPNVKGNYDEGMSVMKDAHARKGYRLPTQKEWQYSCRSGTETMYFFGGPSSLLAKYGWYDITSPKRTQPVGSLKPNDFGLFDINGNVWEWCEEKPEIHRNVGDVRVIYHVTKSKKFIHEGYIDVDSRYFSQEVYDKFPRFRLGGAFDVEATGVCTSTADLVLPPNRYIETGFRPIRTMP
jgi:formylglycine-generating enzyme required for sulfatase activity